MTINEIFDKLLWLEALKKEKEDNHFNGELKSMYNHYIFCAEIKYIDTCINMYTVAAQEIAASIAKKNIDSVLNPPAIPPQAGATRGINTGSEWMLCGESNEQ